MTGPISLSWGAATDVGLRRSLNEDAHLATPPVFLVADGMGGHNAGEVASATAVDEFARLAGRPSVGVDALHETVRRARRRVDALSPDGGAGAGTTLAGVVVADLDGEGYWLALNLGDSRTYRMSDGELEQISVDHSLVQELVDAGQLDPGSAATDSRRNVITRALGAGSDADPDYWLLPAESGDRILVCSDGLTGEVGFDLIARVLREERHPQNAADRLVHEAVVAGGRDNVTVLVVDALAVRSRHPGDGTRTVPTLPLPDELEEDTLPRSAARTPGDES